MVFKSQITSTKLPMNPNDLNSIRLRRTNVWVIEYWNLEFICYLSIVIWCFITCFLENLNMLCMILYELLIFFYSLETASVDRTASESANGLLVCFCRISFMFGEVKLGIVKVITLHQPVPGYFGDDGGRRYGNAQVVSFGNRFLG